MGAKSRTWLIINPAARKGRRKGFLAKLSRELKRLEVNCEIITSRFPEEPALLAQNAVRHGYEVVVAVGGDGLVGQVAGQLVGSETALGIVPAGVGNDFARALGIPARVRDACHVLSDGYRRTIDVGRVNGRYFVSVAGTGFAAEVNRRANRIKWFRSRGLYTMTALSTVLDFRPRHYTISFDGQERCHWGWLVAVGNTRNYAGGMRFLPGALPDDGYLDVCVVAWISRGALLRAFPRVFLGTHINHPAVEILRVRQITIEMEPPGEIYADGERVGPLPATLSVVPRSLTLIVPREGCQS